MKTEPGSYSIDDLARDGTTPWDGVRNYQARNYMWHDMGLGDDVIVYHSMAKPPGVAGLGAVASEPYPDPTQFDESSPYFDPRSSPDDPRWWLVDVAYRETFPRFVPLGELRETPELADMALLNRSRLSVQPVTDAQFEIIVRLARST